MTDENIPFGKIVYCKLAECEGWLGNMFRCRRFYTGRVIGDKLETISFMDLDQGDIIYFLPLSPVGSTRDLTIAVVHGVLESGAIVLGNVHMTRAQIKELNDLHVSGRI